MASAKPGMTRDGTMQVTAKEGIALLKASGKDTLLEMQGLKDGEKPPVKKAGTMEATAKEGLSLLEGTSLDPDAATRGQQKKLDAIGEEDAPPTKKPRMSKATTMVNTAKEAKDLLGAAAPDSDAMTRGQQKKIEEIQSEKPSPKKPKLSKNTTMAATAKEGSALVAGEKLGDTRQDTKKKAAKPSPIKKHTTIQKTLEEAKYVVDDVDVTEGRRLRSTGKPKPAPAPAKLKKAGTMQKTAKEGKEFLKRGKTPKKQEVDEEEEEDVE
ncbi:hypothetical protein MAR_005301 [Mya arenaria]|uniref:Uncharacterized protein n=1 Tax=Mya arenaria TaxID=6604 RepID=A0ABY7F2C3_MYAAR|nr:uncharacterized protein LOC128203315 [Mya arenaria]WAR15196.1 hypothetical protein MAR_005301 [Mya arenaria]